MPQSRTLGAARPPTSDHDMKLPSPVSDCGHGQISRQISPAVKVVLYKERVRREQSASAELSNTAHVYCGDVMCNGNMLSCATGIRI